MYNELLDESLVNVNRFKNLVLNIGTSTEDWTPALQAANDFITASGQNGAIVIPQDIQIRDTFYWDIAKVSLLGNGAKIIADINNTAKYAIVTASSNPEPLEGEPDPNAVERTANQCTTRIQGLVLTSKTKYSCSGIFFNGTSDAKSPYQLSISETAINYFYYAENYGTHSYCISHYNCSLLDNAVAVLVDSVYGINYGERISYTNCTLDLNYDAINMNHDNSDLYFINCTISNCTHRIFECTNGKLYLTDCHMEAPATNFMLGNYPCVLGNNNGNLVIITGGSITLNGTGSTLDYVFKNDAAGKGGLFLDSVHLEGCNTSSRRLCFGTGFVQFKNIYGNNPFNNSMLIHEQANLLSDGGFENIGGISDDIYIAEDTSQVAPHAKTGVNMNFGITTEQAHNFNRSLKLTKIYGAGSASAVMATVPVSFGTLPYAEMYFKKVLGTMTGDMTISFGLIKKDETGVMRAMAEQGSQVVTFTSSAVDWTLFKTPNTVTKTPMWATHFYVKVSLFGTTAGSVYIDDLFMSEI